MKKDNKLSRIKKFFKNKKDLSQLNLTERNVVENKIISKIIKKSESIKYAEFKNCIFTDFFFENYSFEKLHFKRCVFKNGLIKNSNFKDCIFESCIFEEFDIEYSTIEKNELIFCSLFNSEVNYNRFLDFKMSNSNCLHGFLRSNFFESSKFMQNVFFDYLFNKNKYNSPVSSFSVIINYSNIENEDWSNLDFDPLKGNMTFNSSVKDTIFGEKSHIPMICPEEGSFIGYKNVLVESKCGNIYSAILKMEIPSDAERVCGSSRQCRASKVKALEILPIGEKDTINYEPIKIYSRYDPSFEYKIGEIATPLNGFNSQKWVDYVPGIHFFMTKKEAENYEL